MKEINYVVYDLETGGFSAEKHGLEEIALIGINGETLEEIERYVTLIQPYGLEHDPGAEKTTGITLEMLITQGRPAKQVAKEIGDFFTRMGSGRFKKPILVGHNIVDFDNKFLVKFLSTFKKDLNSLINKDQIIDTMWMSRMIGPFDGDISGKHTLGEACHRNGIEVVDAHRAENDAGPNAQLFIQWMKKLRGQSQEIVQQQQTHSFRDSFSL